MICLQGWAISLTCTVDFVDDEGHNDTRNYCVQRLKESVADIHIFGYQMSVPVSLSSLDCHLAVVGEIEIVSNQAACPAQPLDLVDVRLSELLFGHVLLHMDARLVTCKLTFGVHHASVCVTLGLVTKRVGTAL